MALTDLPGLWNDFLKAIVGIGISRCARDFRKELVANC
jgi:hypothetical protein